MRQLIRLCQSEKRVCCLIPSFTRFPLFTGHFTRKEVLDISAPFTDAASSIIDDSFLRCFTSMPPDNWNWNLYLFPLWCLGVVLRHCILFPLRLLLLMAGFVIFFVVYFTMRAIFRVSDAARVAVGMCVFQDSAWRRKWERALVCFQCSIFVASWTGVVKFHGPRPVSAANRVWVANHTSIIDYIILCSYRSLSDKGSSITRGFLPL